MIHQLVYISTRASTCTEEDINEILHVSQKNNKELNLTGVLLYSDTHFYQCIEGDKESLDQLYDHIKKDTRHSNAILISKAAANARDFSSWEMAGKHFDNDQIMFDSLPDAQYKAEFESFLRGDKVDLKRAVGVLKTLFLN